MTENKLKDGYSFLIYDATIGDTPLEVGFMEILDELGVGTGVYNSINSLHQTLGNSFVPVPYLKEGMMLIHLTLGYGKNANGDNDAKELDKELKKLLKIDMRDGHKKTETIDYALVTVDSYGIFDNHEIKSVPSWVIEEVVL